MFESIRDKLFSPQPDQSNKTLEDKNGCNLNAGAALLEKYVYNSKFKFRNYAFALELLVPVCIDQIPERMDDFAQSVRSQCQAFRRGRQGRRAAHGFLQQTVGHGDPPDGPIEHSSDRFRRPQESHEKDR